MSSNGPPKFAALVFNAIRRLQDVQGSTTKEINNYIAQEYNVPNKDIRRQVQVALRRGLSYGILQRAKGGYYVCNKLSPPNALREIQDESAFCCKYATKRKKKMKVKRASCRSASRRKSRSRKAGCGCKRGMKKKSRRKSSRKCGSRRSRSRSKRRSQKSRRSCRPKRSRSMKRKKSRRSSSRSGCPRKPKCGEINISKSDEDKEGNINSNTSLTSGTEPGRQDSSNRCHDDD